jgi:hypothetical protein
MSGKADLAASVSARLLNQARQTGDDYQALLTHYCLERFLYRLGASDRRDRYVLKGAMLLRLWADRPYRATRDVDLLCRGEGTFESILDDLRAVIATPAPPDAVSFDGDRIRMEAIHEGDKYAGTRAVLPARCGNARLMLQIDMGFGDAVWPAPRACTYPALLEFQAPDVLAYPREAVIAEKFEAIVVLGDRNSRIKDFFDLHHLARHFGFDRPTLCEALRQTFERRGTPIPAEAPIGLTRAYWENPSRPAQIRAFARRAGLAMPDGFPEECAEILDGFLSPLLQDLRDGRSLAGTWRPGGPWQ